MRTPLPCVALIGILMSWSATACTTGGEAATPAPEGAPEVPTRERAFVAWLGPRGIVAAAVASLFAYALDAAEIPGGRELSSLVFLVIAVTVGWAALTGGLAAHVLGLRRKSGDGWVVVGGSTLARELCKLLAREGGVLRRAGHTEAVVDISRLAGLNPSAVICEIMNEDGTMARLPELVDFAAKHGLKIGTISDLIAYRHQHDNLVRETRNQTVTSEHGGDWQMRVFADQISGTEHIALIKGDITTPEPVLVRAHALNELEDVLGLGPGPSDELPLAMNIIADEGRGAVLLFREPHPRLDFGEEDQAPKIVKRTGLGSQMMATLGLKDLILLTDSPSTRYLGIDAFGLSIVGTRPIHQGG